MKLICTMFLVLSLPIFSGCASTLWGARVTPTDLRENPDEFDGKRVRVIAVLSARPENYNLWTSVSDLENINKSACLSIENYEWLRAKSPHFDGRRVEATGIFRKDVVGDKFVVRLDACSRAALRLDGKDPIKFIGPAY